jgi:hypothetical protein
LASKSNLAPAIRRKLRIAGSNSTKAGTRPLLAIVGHVK